MSKIASKAAERSVIMFTLSYLLVASLLAWRTENWEFVLYIVIVLIAGLLLMQIHRKVQFSTGVLWLLSIWGLMHMLGGFVPVSAEWPLGSDKAVLYNLWLIPYVFKYDNLVHAYGFGVCTWTCWQILQPIVTGEKEYVSEIILAVFASNGLGALNEIIEFFAVLWLPNTNVGGYENTGWDLVFNIIGSCIAAFIIWFGKPIEIDLSKTT